MLKKFVALFIFCSFLFPVAAAAETIPEYNPLCWRKDQCEKSRADLANQTVEQMRQSGNEGWVSEAPCLKTSDNEWGKCLPAGVTKTSISLGGRNKFSSLGAYVAVIYKYALSIAGIVAAIMVFVAGFQYVTSGGNSEAITSAKKRIGGALMGVFLAYMSYFILSAINPALTTLRLPQTWMIRPQNLVPAFCSAAPSGTLFAYVTASTEQDKVVTGTANPFDLTYSGRDENGAIDKDKVFYCGNRYLMKDGGSVTCFGDVCEAGASCLPFTINPNGEVTKQAKCQQGQLTIHYHVTSLKEALVRDVPFAADLEGHKWLDTDTTFWGVCKTGGGQLVIGDKFEEWDGGSEYKNVVQVANKSATGFDEYYISYGGFDTAHDKSHWSCPAGSTLEGFVMQNEIGVNWSVRDANLSIGVTGGNFPSPVAGAWGIDVHAANYFPYSVLVGRGLYLDLPIDSSMIAHVVANKGAKPTKDAGNQ